MLQRRGQSARPVLQRRIHCLKIFRESDSGLARIPFGKSCEDVGITDSEMTLDPIIPPGQTQNLNRPRATGAVGMAVKPPVEKHIPGPDLHAASKAGFYKGA